jgi:plasmid stabilization system protein ParE
MNVRVLSLARQELEDAVAWYEEQGEGLGSRFLDAMDKAVRRVVAFPLSAPEIDPGFRRCLLTRFPYGLIYVVEDDDIVIVAVSHLHRSPRYRAEKTG